MAYTPKNATIANELSGMKYQGLINFGQAVHDSMFANAGTFPVPSPPLPTLQSDVLAMQTALNAWGAASPHGSNSDLVSLREKRLILMADINLEAGYVLGIARAYAGDFIAQTGIITIAGMRVRSIPSRAALFGQPQNLHQLIKVEYAKTGNILLRWKRPLIEGSYSKPPISYIIQQSANGADPWVQIGVSSKTSYLATGYTSGQSSYFRVLPVGVAGIGSASDPCQGMAQ